MLGAVSFEINCGNALDTADQRAGLILLGSMLLSFGFIRFSTRMIRAEVSWWPGNVSPGGLHIHHLVFGIVFMMVAGFVAFAVEPNSPWFEIAAGLFGIGMGLTLDEFALWLHLEDVYWAEQGRSSVDAVIFAAIIGGGYIVGFTSSRRRRQFDAGNRQLRGHHPRFLRDRRAQGQDKRGRGRHVHPPGRLGGCDPARPDPAPGGRSGATRLGSGKLAKAEARKARHDKRVRRFQDLIGGAPSLPSPRTGGGSKPPARLKFQPLPPGAVIRYPLARSMD